MTKNIIDMDNKEFPKYIIIPNDYREELKVLTATVNKAVRAYDRLMELPDYPMPDDLADVNVMRLDALVKEKLDAVDSSKFLTAEQVEEVKGGWYKFRTTAKSCIGDVRKLLDDYPEVKVMTNNGCLTCSSDLSDVAEARSKRAVPAEAKTHYTLLLDVFARISALREWEGKHDCKKVPFEELLRMDAEDIARAWVTGSVKIDRQYGTQLNEAIRKAAASLYL